MIDTKGKNMDIANMVCGLDSTIKETMTCIDKNTKGTAFIVNNKGELQGVVTDGDIRRLLLAGFGMNDTIKEHVSEKCIYAYSNEEPEQILKKFNQQVTIIPILDEQHKVIDYAEYDKNMHISLAQPQLNGNEYNYLMDAFLSTWISSTGKYVTRFEKNFSEYCGMQYGVATSNGTTALHLALQALGVGAGDEVIVPDLTFAATINAVIYTGATPVIVDVEEDSWCISPDEIEKAISSTTKAIIPVHVYGQPCNMDRICDIARKHNLYIVEDCAEAHGAEWSGQRVGSFGDISCFSFFGNKVITTGEGGMCVTNSKELNDKMRALRDHGMSKERRYYHEVVGYNYRMTNLQAAIGVAQIERIDAILQWRHELEEKYRTALGKIENVTLQKNDLPKCTKITWLVSILVDSSKRDKLISAFKEQDIDVRAFFIPLSEMEIYTRYARNCIKSKKISDMGINLPTTYEIDEEKIGSITNIIKNVLNKK